MTDRDAAQAVEDEIGGYALEGGAPADANGDGAPADRPAAPGPVRYRGSDTRLDARQLYMGQIQDIPVLSREAVAELSKHLSLIHI